MVDQNEKTSSDRRDFKAPIDFNDLNISNLDSESGKSLDHEGREDYEKVFPVVIGGETYNLLLEVHKIKDEPQNYLRLNKIMVSIFEKNHNLKYVDSREEALVHGWVSLDFLLLDDIDSIKASSGIVKNDNKKILPAGIGIGLYQKFLDYIRDQTKINRKDVVHNVTHEEEVGLDEENWLKIFRPILEDRGYENTTNKNYKKQRWQKTYMYKEK